MGGDLVLLACGGALPVLIAEAYPDARIVTLHGIPSELTAGSERFRLERIGDLFESIRNSGATRMVFAGALSRPPLDPSEFDATMTSLAPRLTEAMQKGDDALLRTVIAVFEEQGIEVVGAHDLLPSLVAEDGLAAGVVPGERDLKDADRAIEILHCISALDIGQGCVVAGGQCLGIETVQGTDALLSFVAASGDWHRNGARGVYVKAAKTGQDLRIDMPAVGPGTIEGVAKARLAGLVVEAGRVLILDRERTLALAERKGLFFRSRSF